ncbi:DNA-deoxyinosine glycosylase [Flavobacterium sp. 7A]|uniref:DNA-deoxyinosine glycosylase n=1 Tax=Flavobacterium sp. 7A TaxID=2940571 RepID=UPI002227B539|nr:DNA-deoxyinosine glycosylase [Flavobacterium sp. 7A]MCW2120007.1 hypoxanthine-DNA glycosylase [Flavobacterium sp. 7A]
MRIDKTKIEKTETSLINTKSSFQPISQPNTEILILGSLPGDKSIEVNEYYGHPRNRFWKIIATISNKELPKNYNDKLALLQKLKIGLWDVAQRANRSGSLDSAIKDEEPNDIDSFLIDHPNLKIIAFNGRTSEALFNKYFDKKKNLKYISLPSTSPANARFSFDALCISWRQLSFE